MLKLGDMIRELGFVAWRALPPIRFDQWEADRRRLAGEGHAVSETMTPDPQDILPGARTLVVLLTAYRPWRDWPSGSLWVHPHYPARQRARRAALTLRERIEEEGYRAADAHDLPQRHAAFAAGFGHAGRNGLLIHPRYGSRICMETLLTDMPLPLSEPVAGEMRRCLLCGACAAACPGGAVGEGSAIYAERCLRHYAPMKREIPEAIRTLLGPRLIGCDDCQSVCPMNQFLEPAAPPEALVRAARLAGLLDWEGEGRKRIRELGQWIGDNEARPVRITAAAALHAGNTGDAAYLPALRRLAAHPDARVREMAAWAVGRISSHPNGPQGAGSITQTN